jgi:hypothetical protein
MIVTDDLISGLVEAWDKVRKTKKIVVRTLKERVEKRGRWKEVDDMALVQDKGHGRSLLKKCAMIKLG